MLLIRLLVKKHTNVMIMTYNFCQSPVYPGENEPHIQIGRSLNLEEFIACERHHCFFFPRTSVFVKLLHIRREYQRRRRGAGRIHAKPSLFRHVSVPLPRKSQTRVFDKCPHLNFDPWVIPGRESTSHHVPLISRARTTCTHAKPRSKRFTFHRQVTSSEDVSTTLHHRHDNSNHDNPFAPPLHKALLFFFFSVYISHSGTSSRQAVQPPSRRRRVRSGTNVRRCCSGTS